MQRAGNFIAAVQCEFGTRHQVVLVGQRAAVFDSAIESLVVLRRVVVDEHASAADNATKILPLRVVVPVTLTQVGAEVEAGDRVNRMLPLACQAQHGKTVFTACQTAVVRGVAIVLLQLGATAATAFGGNQHRHQDQRISASGTPLQTPVEVHAAARCIGAGTLLSIDGLIGGQVVKNACGGAVVVAFALHCGQREVVNQVTERVIARPGRAFLRITVFATKAGMNRVDALAVATAGDDVDAAADGAGTGLGGRRTQDFNALDLIRCQIVQ